MKKIGRFEIKQARSRGEKRIEHLQRFLDENPEWYDYFETITNHNTITSIRNNSVYIYCTIESGMRAKIIEHVKVPDIDRDFCDDWGTEVFISEDGEDAIRFENNIGVIAFYFTGRNTFVMCDATHYLNSEIEHAMNFMLDYVISKGYCLKRDAQEEEMPPKLLAIPNVEISLGADPEFEVRLDGDIVRADEIEEFCGDDECESDEKEWGLDGASNVAEARPAPALTPREAVANMRELFSRVTHHDLSVDGAMYSSGGHIHIGGVDFDAVVDNGLLKLLDSQIGLPTRSMNGRARKNHNNYGQLSDYETKSYGFEYRTPPAGIFYSPRMLELCYKIAKNTAHKWYSGTVDFLCDTAEENLKVWSDFTDEEIEEYFTLISEFEKVRDCNVVAAWVDPSIIKQYVKYYPVIASFSDDYGYYVTTFIRKELAELKTVNKKIRVNMFGLAASRGDNICSGCDIEGLTRIELETNENAIGLSRNIRLTEDRELAKRIAVEIRKHIERTI